MLAKIQIAGPITIDSDLVDLKWGSQNLYETMGISETGDPLGTVGNTVSILHNELFEGCGFGEMEKKKMRG